MILGEAPFDVAGVVVRCVPQGVRSLLLSTLLHTTLQESPRTRSPSGRDFVSAGASANAGLHACLNSAFRRVVSVTGNWQHPYFLWYVRQMLGHQRARPDMAIHAGVPTPKSGVSHHRFLHVICRCAVKQFMSSGNSS